MSLVQSSTRIFLLAIAVLLSSCIDSHEEYWLDADGSGHAEISYDLPSAAARMQGSDADIHASVANFLRDLPSLTDTVCEVVSNGAVTSIKIRTSFKSALDLKDLATDSSFKHLPSTASHLAGEIKADVHGTTLSFIRTMSPTMALPGVAFMPTSQLEGHRLIYIMHLPVAASESNATRVTDDGRTLVWDFPLADSLKAPLITRFKMAIPLPWKLVTAIALPLCLVCGLVLLRKRNARNGRNIPD